MWNGNSYVDSTGWYYGNVPDAHERQRQIDREREFQRLEERLRWLAAKIRRGSLGVELHAAPERRVPTEAFFPSQARLVRMVRSRGMAPRAPR
jgi:hypothetical protein